MNLALFCFAPIVLFSVVEVTNIVSIILFVFSMFWGLYWMDVNEQ